MRDKINILYYPDFHLSHNTLKKCILFFDEIHIMDRPAFTIDNWGLIGAPSPLRSYEESFREAGVPLYVHGVNGGRLTSELLEKVYSDISDYKFIEHFAVGLGSSPSFRSDQFPEGNYDSFGSNQLELINLFHKTDLSLLKSPQTARELLKKKVSPFDKSNTEAILAFLLSRTALCSAQLNFAIMEGHKHGFTPIADSEVYSNLLNSQYLRAADKLEPKKNKIEIADLSFAIFDELISNECIEQIDIKDIVDYRKKSVAAREQFLEYLSSFTVKLNHLSKNKDYIGEINKFIKSEILPAATTFRNKLISIDEIFTGALTKGLIGELGTGGLHVFTDLSWGNIIALAGATGIYVINAAIDNYLAERAHRRECSISYVLSLDKLNK